MQPVAAAPIIYSASGALAGPCPAPVSHHAKPILPDVQEAVFVYVALDVVGPQAGTCRYRAVEKDRSYVDAGVAEEEPIARLTLVRSQKSLARKKIGRAS